MTTDRPLTLDVTDFGPIARADRVELRPLTVFVGPSNTGKSWLATLAYALYRYFEKGPWVRPRWFGTESERPALPQGASEDLVRIVMQSMMSERAEEGVVLTAPVQAATRLHLEEQSEPIGEEIERCFGVEAGARLVRHGSAGRGRVLLRHALEGVPTPAVHELTFGDQEWTFLSTIPDGVRIRGDRHTAELVELLFMGGESESTEPHRTWSAIDALAQDMLPHRRRAFYLPADRTGLMNSHTTVMRVLAQSTTKARRADPIPPQSGVRGDFLEELMKMAPDRRGRTRSGAETLRSLGESLEDGLLGGAIEVGSLPGIAYPHFTYRPSGWGSDMPLTNTSSMVSELAPVVLYLRHVVSPNDLLIIDEPESHLHPAMQVAFTRQIAEIVRAGVRIIVTTHSEWVLEELGNIVGRSRRTNGGNEKPGATSLAAGDVGVWLFEPAENGSGSAVQEIALDADTGLYASGFAAVAAALHNDWASIAGTRGDAE